MAKIFDDTWFKLEGRPIDIGYGMLETVNQMTYPSNNSVTRVDDGAATNIADTEYYTQPSVKIGFNFIKAEDFLYVSEVLHRKQVMDLEYYDNDFGKVVKHECYAHPTELKNFFNVGTRIEGVRDLELTFVATLNDRTSHTVTVKDNGGNVLATYSGILWGRSIVINESGEFTMPLSNGKTITCKSGQRITVFEDITLTKKS